MDRIIFYNTIYKGDTNTDIILYSLKYHPINVIKSLVKARKLKKEYKKGLIPFERVKESMLSFLFQIKNLDSYLDKFVNKHMKNIKQWYLIRKNEKDIVISASYEIWIAKFCKKLKIKNVIATKTDANGKIINGNCKGKEKIVRFKKMFKNAKAVVAYSDSKVDIPMLEYAKNAYVVEGNKLFNYKKGYKFKN